MLVFSANIMERVILSPSAALRVNSGKNPRISRASTDTGIRRSLRSLRMTASISGGLVAAAGPRCATPAAAQGFERLDKSCTRTFHDV